jgi:lipopolysaccharide/colanic/teichoic acid biosynthesis glycosyltransferase
MNRRSLYERGGKRVVDVTGAVMLLVCTMPLLIVIALAIRATLGRPVFYGERRAGRGGVPFTLWKFRSMTNACDAGGRLLPDAERMTTLGRWLRRSSLDELPELIHVLRGTMSLVGPRPLPLAYIPRYSPAQARRLDVLPGLTGLAQVRGRNALDWNDRLGLDTWYVDHRTARLDLEVLLRTVAVVLRGQGVNYPGHATMPEFAGSDGVS